MILSKSNVVHYLLEQRLLVLDSVIDGDLMVTDITRRNRNFKIIRRASPGYFVKQIQNWDPQTVATLASEAMCYRLARGGAEFAPLAALVPRDFLYDSQRHVLVTELLPDNESLSDHHRRLNAFPPDTARLLGTLFGRLHRDPVPIEGRAEATAFRRQPPWILSAAHQQGTNLFGALSAGNAQLLQIVQSYPEFQRTLEELRAEWNIAGLIHGDLKWDNCVVYRAPGNGALALKVVDWELADLGDPRWDLGALLQAYISFWVFSMRISAELPATQIANTAQYPIEAMQPSVRAFWQAYVEARGLDRPAAQALLVSSVKFGAARMIQTAYESMQYSAQISTNALGLLQVSFNILREPSEAVTHLLGL
jgi:Phosphotransferase enzyme family